MLGRLLALWALAAGTVAAAEIEQLTVERNAGRIEVASVMLIEAPQRLVFGALADYEHFAELSSRYKQSRFIEPAADGTPRIYTELEGCVWFFCRTIRRNSRLELFPDERIVATVEPEGSDLAYGREEWLLAATAGPATRVTYTHAMEPDFWIPPLIGIWAMRKALESDALKAAGRIEDVALGRAPVVSPGAAAEPAGQ
jgi:hypothetical protein